LKARPRKGFEESRFGHRRTFSGVALRKQNPCQLKIKMLVGEGRGADLLLLAKKCLLNVHPGLDG